MYDVNLDRFTDVIGKCIHLAVFQYDGAVQPAGEGARPNQQLCVHAIKCHRNDRPCDILE